MNQKTSPRPVHPAHSLVLGVDAGSVSVKLALVALHGDAGAELLHWEYRRHRGRPLTVAAEMIDALLRSRGLESLPVAATGGPGKTIAERLSIPHVNELTACTAGCRALAPQARTIFEMGGEDAKYILLDGDAVADFSMNSVCAAGTGSFLDQQAERMQLSIEAFGALGLESKQPPRIAGRCSVFAKSDMIHLQQIATPMEDIVAGLHFAVARNFKGAIVRNRPVAPPVAFLGGVAMNPSMARAMREVFGLEAADALCIPSPPTVMAAAGAALRGREEATAVTTAALAALQSSGGRRDAGRPPLLRTGDSFRERHMSRDDRVRGDKADSSRAAGKRIPAWLGVDIGSISTCLALVDDDGDVLCKRYLRTASRPLEAVRTGLAEVQAEVGDAVDVKGVGATGSGRYMIADFMGADVVKNEITAQARGAAHIDPRVDTIFEIGGQDSKYISLKDGVITDFEMNKACAAGTGSFLEEQAEKLSVAVKDEFAGLALEADSPCRLGERCTVFMENSLQHHLFRGAERQDLLGGLAYSIVENYINRVVAGRPIGERIFFQGGTAFNKAVVAAFEKHLDTTITVPPHHDNTGAIGMALIARDHTCSGARSTAFRGFDLASRSYSLSSFTCNGCDNQCEINRVTLDGEKGHLFYGGRCEKYDIRKDRPALPDLFAARETALERAHAERAARFAAGGSEAPRGRIGLPRVFFLHDYLPFYATLLWELGFEPVVSPPTTHAIAGRGVRATLADTCYPVKAALGHVAWLLDHGVETIFMPSFINMARPESAFTQGHACPLTQSFPYYIRTAFGRDAARVVAPPLSMKHGPAAQGPSIAEALAETGISVSRAAMRHALQAAASAQEAFGAELRELGREALDRAAQKGERTLAIIGRPYNACDRGMNLDIPKKLASLGVQAMPMDFLPEQDLHETWPEMYWRSGQRILSAARLVRNTDHLHALVIGSFSCGPDSFIAPFFEKEMAGKPHLHLEIDEHSADAGMITRCEAFLDSLEMQERAAHTLRSVDTDEPPRRTAFQRARRTVFIPRMSDHAFAIEAAFQGCGVDAVVMDRTDDEAVALARQFVSGKECYPFAVTTGDMLKKAFSPGFDPARSAFFIWSGTGPCRFGQYNVLQRMILRRAGFGDAAVFSPVQDAALYSEVGDIGKQFSRLSWEGIVAVDLLTRCLHETRPKAVRPAEAEEAYAEGLQRIRHALASRNGGLPAAMADIRHLFEDVSRNPEPRPRIGIVGEIFVRSNRFSNEELVRKVEALGGEAWLSPIDEWVYYVNWCAARNAAASRDWKKHVQVRIKDHFQKRIARKLEAPFDGFLETIHDPGTPVVLDNAAEWLHHSFRGEAVLSMGKAVDMLRRGVSGVLNAMPFGCMPGSVVAALLRDVTSRTGTPSLSLPYDGSESATLELQLETFMEQARDRRTVSG